MLWLLVAPCDSECFVSSQDSAPLRKGRVSREGNLVVEIVACASEGGGVYM